MGDAPRPKLEAEKNHAANANLLLAHAIGAHGSVAWLFCNSPGFHAYTAYLAANPLPSYKPADRQTLNSLAATREGVWYLNSRHVTIDEGGSLNKKEMIHYSFSELIFLGSSRKFSTRAQNS